MYRLQLTHAGDYIVRGKDGRECGRAANENEAEAIMASLVAENAERGREMTVAIEADQEFRTATPDLTRTQLRWQIWRSWLYDELRHEERRLHSQRNWLDRQTGDSPTLHGHETRDAEETGELLDGWSLYDRMVALDTRIKAARREHDHDALAAALAEAEPLVARADAMAYHNRPTSRYA